MNIADWGKTSVAVGQVRMERIFVVERSQEWYEKETTIIWLNMEHQDLVSVCSRFVLKTEAEISKLRRT